MDCFDKQLVKVGGMAGGMLVLFGVAMISAGSLSDPTVGEGALSRDAAYTGSLTLAGLAIFGSALASRIGSSTKPDLLNRGALPAVEPSTGQDSLDRRTGILLATLAPFVLAVIHLLFAAYMCCNDPGPLVMWLALFSGALMAMSLAGYVMLMTNPRRPKRN